MTGEDIPEVLWDLLEETESDPERLRQLLSKMPRETLKAFHQAFRLAIANLWHSPVEDVARQSCHGSEDAIQDFFISIIGKGKDYYDKVLEHSALATCEATPRQVDIYGIAGEVLRNRFGEEIGIPEGVAQPTTVDGSPVILAIPLDDDDLTDQEQHAQSAILEDFQQAGFQGRLISFTSGKPGGMRFLYLVDDFLKFQEASSRIMRRHLPGRVFEVRLENE